MNTPARKGSRLDGRLKVLNLASITSDGDLRTLFAEVGHVVDVNIMRDRRIGTCCGYGYVTMSALSEADAAVSRLNGRSLNGLPLEIALLHPRVVHGWHSG